MTNWLIFFYVFIGCATSLGIVGCIYYFCAERMKRFAHYCSDELNPIWLGSYLFLVLGTTIERPLLLPSCTKVSFCRRICSVY